MKHFYSITSIVQLLILMLCNCLPGKANDLDLWESRYSSYPPYDPITNIYSSQQEDINNWKSTSTLSNRKDQGILPTILRQPLAKTLCPGQDLILDMEASDVSSWQWQVDAGSGFMDITPDNIHYDIQSSDEPIFSVHGVMEDLNGYKIRCVLSNDFGQTISDVVTIHLSTLKAEVESQNPSCYGSNNGSAILHITGGDAPYTYNWSTGAMSVSSISGLAQGYYNVTVTDANSCVSIDNFYIQDPVQMSVISSDQQDVTCNGGNNGSATVAVSGGTAPYSYEWSPSGGTEATATGLKAGKYTVTIIDDNACSITKEFTIVQPPALAATTMQTNVSCYGGNNGTASVTVDVGTAPYTYAWSPSGGTGSSATGLKAGVYTVTITDHNSCSITKNVSISQPAPISVTSTQSDNLCYDGASALASVNATGGMAPFTYSWSTGKTGPTAMGLKAGTYTATVTDVYGCKATKDITITEPVPFTSTITRLNATCNGDANGSATVTVSGGRTPYTYTWSNGEKTDAISGLKAGNYNVTVSDYYGCTTTSATTITQPTALVVTPSQKNISCNGGANGTATVSVSGGSAPYRYSWSPQVSSTSSASGLSAGTYSVIVSDANDCSVTQTFNITEPTAISVTTSQTDISCNGGGNGSATVNVSGGTLPYSYNWTPTGGNEATATGLSAGNYLVTISDKNTCTTIKNFTLTQPLAMSVTASKTDVSCNGGGNGSATVTVSGGSTPYTYSWSPSGGTGATATGLSAGNYTVTITDKNSCTITQNITITEPDAMSVATTQNNVSCNGGANGSAGVIVSGGAAPYTYSWAPSGGTEATATGLSAGNYTVTITDKNSCITTKKFTIVQPTALSASTSQSNVSCNGGGNGSASVNVTGGTAPYTYLWSPSGGNGATATGLSAGFYSVTITDDNACSTTKNFTISQPSRLSVTSTQSDNLCNGGANGSANVSATGGTAPYTYSWSTGETGPTATGLKAGTYTATVTDANGCSSTKDIIITQPAIAYTSAISTTNVACNGGATGSALVTVSGGVSPYTYAWSNGENTNTISGLKAGDYSITVTDAVGCTTANATTITQPAALVYSASQKNVSCFGEANGTATINVSGGSLPYSYSWTPRVSSSSYASDLIAGSYTVIVSDANNCTLTKTFNIVQPLSLSATTLQTNPSCNGGANGSATVNVSGGTAPYSYTWTPSGGTGATATGLSAGNYTVTITDKNSCATTKNITIAEPNAISVSTTQNNVSCNGGANGSASVNVTGGTVPYTYSWSPSGGTAATATGLTVGTYTVTITDGNACSTKKDFTITQPAALTVVTSQNNVSCNGGANGSASVDVTGGSGTYTYSWSPSGGTAATAKGLTAGIYTVTITDGNSCQTTKNFTILQPAALTVIGSQNNVSCNGGGNGSASVNVTGGTAPYTYLWSPSGGTAATATGLNAGNYTVTITDANACSTTKNFSILQPATLSVTSAQTDVSCNGESNGSANITVTGGTAPYTYSWSPSGGTAAIATGLGAGSYKVTITDKNGCTTSKSITILQPMGIAVTTSQKNVSCYGSNDGTATLTVSGGTGPYSYSWYPSGGNAATATGLKAGTYTATIVDANNCQASAKITITEPKALDLHLTTTAVTQPGGNDGSISAAASGGTTPYTYTWTPNAGNTAIIDNLSIGAYICKVADANGCNVSQSASVQGPATINVPKTLTAIYGDDPFKLNYSSNSNGAVTIESSNTDIAVVNGATIKVLKPGVTTITTTQGADAGYSKTTASTTLTVTAKPLQVSFNTTSVITKLYDGTKAATINKDSYVLTGIVNGDNVTVDGVATYASKDQGTDINVIWSDLKLSGLQKNYYQLTTDQLTGKGNILPMPVTIKANFAEKVYGQNDPQDLGYTTTQGKLIAGDTFTGKLVREAGENANSYLILKGTLSLSSNYLLTFTESLFTITKAPLLITAEDKRITLGMALPELTYTFSGFVNNENLSVLKSLPQIGTIANSTSPAGIYPITIGNAAADNYDIKYQNANLTITPVESSQIVVPNNVITPNNDGYNDKWIIEHIELFPENEVKIFDRSGRIVFQRNSYKNEWDGTMNGKPLQTGAYLYIIILKDKPVIKGYLTIVR